MSLIGYHHRQLPSKLAKDTVNEDGYYCCCPIFHDDLTSDVVCNVYILNCDNGLFPRRLYRIVYKCTTVEIFRF
jgi:hypothetical protein